MGFFSNDCLHCGHPMLSPMATENDNKWMSTVVVITRDGSILQGQYDGYGNVNGREANADGDTSCWHKACWEAAGSPAQFTEASENSADQGWFFDDGVHNWPSPEQAREHPDYV